MKLKTYTAETMAQALAQVRKDLGKDAMILHTRSFRVGSWFGFGGKTMVEITASSAASPVKSKKTRPMPRVAQPTLASHEQMQEAPQPEIVIQRGTTVTRQRLATSAPVAASHQSSLDTTTEISSGNSSGNSSGDARGLNARDALFADEPQAGRTNDSVSSRFIEQRLDNHLADKITEIKPKPITQPTVKPTVKPVTKQAVEPKLAGAGLAPEPETNKQADGVQTNDELRAQIDTLSKMMGQVLESTRKTAVAVGNSAGESTLPSGEMPAPLFALYAKMMDNDVPVELADKLVGSVRDRLDAIELKDELVVRQTLLRAIEATIEIRTESILPFDHSSSTGRPRVIVLVGPTGVGKTTTVAKLAATYKLRHGKTVGLITSDTYRIAAVEQLRTYSQIIGLPLKVANSPEELAQAIEELGSSERCDVIVIDTAGRSQHNTRRLEELAEFTKAAKPDETHLVLSTTVGDNVLRKTAQSFKALGPDRCILTKLDEAVTTGPIAGLSDRIGLPLSFLTVGQEVPDDLEIARADKLARCVLDGPEAVVRRWSEDNG